MRTILCLGILVINGANSAYAANNDYDNDGISDLVIYRPNFPSPGLATWFVRTSSGAKPTEPPWQNTWTAVPGGYYKQYGLNGDYLAPGDYDADGSADLAVVYPPYMVWWFYSTNGSPPWSVQLGLPTDYVTPGCYMSQNIITDMAVFRPSNDTSYIRDQYGVVHTFVHTPPPGGIPGNGRGVIRGWRPFSSHRATAMAYYEYQAGTIKRVKWAKASNASGFPDSNQYHVVTRHGDTPLIGNYAGSAWQDLVRYRPSTGQWFIARDTNPNQLVTPIPTWGNASEVPVVGDYDGDGFDDLCVWNTTTGDWWVMSSGSIYNVGLTPPHMTYISGTIGTFKYNWGALGDTPVP